MTALGAKHLRHHSAVWWISYLMVIGGGVLLTAFARRRLTQPFLGLSLAIILLVLTVWLVRPRLTLYAVIVLTTVSDVVTVSWFPFVKNFSSRESISFVADAITISPLDLALIVGVAVSMTRQYADHRRLIAPNAGTYSVVAFTVFVAYGFARGLTMGGDSRIAVLVGRPLLYIALVFVIAANELTRPEHRRHAMYALTAGVVLQSLLSIEYLTRLDYSERADLESLNEHGSAIGQNLVLITFLILMLFGIRHATARWAFGLALLPVTYVYFVSQRRAGVAALIIALVLTTIMMFWRVRKRFYVVVPAMVVVGGAYVAAFWNSTSSLAFPAQAVRTIIAPESASWEDQSSDLYRMMEAFDLNFTIRADPIQGHGFGRPFYRPIELPDISSFELNAYQPHNSVLWVWIVLGYFGFVAMFYFVGKSVMVGTARARELPLDLDFVIAWAATMYVVMYAIYSYVDVSWDARNTVMLGLTAAICGQHAVAKNAPANLEPPALSLDTDGDHEGATSSERTTSATRSA